MTGAEQRYRNALREIAETNDAAITVNVMCAAIMRSIARQALSQAIAAGSAETGETRAQSEGCQSVPKGSPNEH